MGEELPEVHAISRSQEAAKGGIAFSIPNAMKVEFPLPPKTFLKKQARKAKLEDGRAKTWSCPRPEVKTLQIKRRASCDDVADGPLPDPEGVLKHLLNPLSNEWTEQTEQILQLRRLVRHHPDTLIPELGHTLTVLEGFCNSLRSSVQRCAVQVYCDIFRQTKLSSMLVNHLPRVLELLCTHATLANKFIREECESVILCGIEEFSAKRMLMGLVKVKHHNKSVQAQVSISLAAATKALPAPFSDTIVNALLPVVASCSQEGLEQSRQAATAILSELQAKADDSVLTPAFSALSFQQQHYLLSYASSHSIKLPSSLCVLEPPATTKKRIRGATANKENIPANESNKGLLKAAKTLESFINDKHNNNNDNENDPSPPTSPSFSAASSSSFSFATSAFTTSTIATTPVSVTRIHDGNTLTTMTIPNEDLLLSTPVILHKRVSPSTVTYTYAHAQESPCNVEDTFGMTLGKTTFSELTASVVYSDREENSSPMLELDTCKTKLDQVSQLLSEISATRAAGNMPAPGCLVQVVALQREITDCFSRT